MKQKWQSFLDTIHFAKDKSTRKRTLILFGVFLWAIVAILAPYYINQTYQHALYSSVLSLFMLITLLLYVKKQWTFNEAKWSYNYPSILCNIGIVVLALNMLYLMFPVVRISPQPMGSLQEETVYVMYRSDCPYCAVANRNFNRAFSAYNATHGNNVRVVDMNQPSTAASEALEYIDQVGTVLYIDEHNQGHTDFYTLGHEDGTPMAPSVEYIYQTLKQFEE